MLFYSVLCWTLREVGEAWFIAFAHFHGVTTPTVVSFRLPVCYHQTPNVERIEHRWPLEQASYSAPLVKWHQLIQLSGAFIIGSSFLCQIE